jgi:transcriptional regulator NrdR family protein
MNQVSVIKQGSKRVAEPFSANKLFESILAACLSVRLAEGAAEHTAGRTTKEVENWLINKSEVTSNDIRRQAAKTLIVLCPEAGYLYQQNKTIM